MWMVCPRAAGRKSFRNRADGALEQETGAGKMACMECLTNAEDRVKIRPGRRKTRTVTAGHHILEAYDEDGHIIDRMRIYVHAFKRSTWSIGE